MEAGPLPVILAALALCALAAAEAELPLPPVMNGTGFRVAENGTALVSSAMGLHTVLCDRVGHDGTVLLARGVLLEPLAFVPRLPVPSDVAVCGTSRDVAVAVEGPFRMATLLATFSWCNLTLDLGSGASLGGGDASGMFEIASGGRVEYVDCVIYMEAGPFAALAAQVDERLKGGRGAKANLGERSMTIIFAALPTATLRRVEVRLRDAEHKAGDRVVVQRAADLDALRQAATPSQVPLEVALDGNYSVTGCLLGGINGGRALEVRRPVTITGAGGSPPWLAFPEALPDGFLDIRVQVRYVGAGFDNRHVRFSLINGSSLPETDTPEAARAALSTLEGAAHVMDLTSAGCRLVMLDSAVVYSCEYMRTVALQLLYYRNDIGDQALQRVLDEQVWVNDTEAVGNSTLHVHRFMGWGLCMQNVSVTCEAPEVRNATSLGCEESPDGGDGGQPRTNRSTGDDNGDGMNGVELDRSFGNPETSAGGETTGETGVRPAVGRQQLPEAALSAAAGGVLVTLLAALAVVWRRKVACRCEAAEPDLLSLWGGRAGCSRRRPAGDEEDGMASGRRGETECDAASFSRRSFLGAVSNASEGLDDVPARIEAQIAVGGCGVVYKGTWKGVPVAIKTVVFQDLEEAPSRPRQRAVLEAAISSSVAHRNIVQTYSYSFKRLETSAVEAGGRECPRVVADGGRAGTVDWKLYIVQEFCDGGSLRECLDQRRLLDPCTAQPMFGVVCQIGLEAARGMRHLHAHKIIHGDLSSKNVLLKSTGKEGAPLGTAKIADFGLSMKLEGVQSHVSNQRAGTPFYIAPELIHDGLLSKKADVFAMGVFLWELYHSRKCYHLNKTLGMRYHPLFPKFPIICPIPYAMLCVVCISPKPENRPDFDFIVRVLAAMKRKYEQGDYDNLEDVRFENMSMAGGLGRLTAADIIKLIAEKVGVCSHDTTSGASTSCSKESCVTQPTLDVQGMMLKFPQSVFIPSSEQDVRDNELYKLYHSSSDDDYEEDGQECIHLSQAYMDPFQCVLTVNVDTDKGRDPGPKKERLSLAWETDRPVMGWDEPEGDVAQDETTSRTSSDSNYAVTRPELNPGLPGQPSAAREEVDTSLLDEQAGPTGKRGQVWRSPQAVLRVEATSRQPDSPGPTAGPVGREWKRRLTALRSAGLSTEHRRRGSGFAELSDDAG
eukprot:evm.model.scf_3883.2 EVM.evm.TU.scf_3883.2   scf_3883:5939-9466(-)